MIHSRSASADPASLRVSDAERERVAAFLTEGAAEGRLAPDELEDRAGRAYHAHTAGELWTLVADLPGGAAALPGAGLAPTHRSEVPARRGGRRVGLWCGAALLALVVAAVEWPLGTALAVTLLTLVSVVAVSLLLAVLPVIVAVVVVAMIVKAVRGVAAPVRSEALGPRGWARG